MKVLCIGHVTYDITFPIDDFPLENSKNRYSVKEECIGGSASIAALLLGRWNLDVQVCAVAGNDNYGRRIKKEFSLNGVQTSNLVLKDGYDTSKSVILVNRMNGSRTVLGYDPRDYFLDSVQLSYVPDIILMDGYEGRASVDLIRRFPAAISVLDADKNKPDILGLAKMVNYLICSKDFAESVTGVRIDYENKNTLIDVYSKMEKEFKNNIIITLGYDGCLYKYKNQIKVMPSVRVKSVDSTGAGDIFRGAFVYGLVNNFDLEKNLKFSNIAGALSVTRIGGYKSIPSLGEMKEVYNEVK